MINVILLFYVIHLHDEFNLTIQKKEGFKIQIIKFLNCQPVFQRQIKK